MRILFREGEIAARDLANLTYNPQQPGAGYHHGSQSGPRSGTARRHFEDLALLNWDGAVPVVEEETKTSPES